MGLFPRKIEISDFLMARKYPHVAALRIRPRGWDYFRNSIKGLYSVVPDKQGDPLIDFRDFVQPPPRSLFRPPRLLDLENFH